MEIRGIPRVRAGPATSQMTDDLYKHLSFPEGEEKGIRKRVLGVGKLNETIRIKLNIYKCI